MNPTLLMQTFPLPLLKVDSADFDATNDYMTRGAGLTGAGDSKTGIASWWWNGGISNLLTGAFLKTDSLAGLTSRSQLFGPAIAAPRIQFRNAGGSVVLDIHHIGLLTAAGWWHCLSSWDLNAGVASLRVSSVANGVFETQNLASTALVNDTIDYTLSNWRVGAELDGSNLYGGDLAELYFAPGQYLDFSLVVHRRKFISAGGKPVYLGATGQLPTGTAPLVYLHLDDGETVANFATNRGTGGNFTITGTLGTGSTSPSD